MTVALGKMVKEYNETMAGTNELIKDLEMA